MKQLIILVAYVEIGSMSFEKTRTRCAELRAILNKTFSEEVQQETNTIIRTIVIPVKDQPTYIECIYPSEPYLSDEILEKLEQIELTQKEYDGTRT